MKRVVLLGPPGVGKGTQAGLISKKYELTHISTGDIFRANLKQGTPLGLKAKEYMDKGLLVPDELVCDLVKDRVQQDDCKNGYLLDGFPRTVYQAENFDKYLKDKGEELSVVLNIQAPFEDLFNRAAGRRVCKQCGKTYNVISLPPKTEGICDVCGGELLQRPDDALETVQNRLKVYEDQTSPLIEYYRTTDRLADIDGCQAIDGVFGQICALLGEKP